MYEVTAILPKPELIIETLTECFIEKLFGFINPRIRFVFLFIFGSFPLTNWAWIKFVDRINIIIINVIFFILFFYFYINIYNFIKNNNVAKTFKKQDIIVLKCIFTYVWNKNIPQDA